MGGFSSFIKGATKVVSGIGQAAAPVAGAIIGGPVGALVGTGVSGALGSVDSLMNAHEQKDANNLQWDRTQYLNQVQQDFNAQEAEKSRLFNSEEAEKSRLFNSQEALAQRQWQEQMMDKTNEYNTPANQLARMQAAGLNPNLFNTQVSQGIGAGEGSMATSTPAQGASAFMNPLNPPPQFNPSLVAAQARNLNAQSDNLEVLARKAEEEINEIQEFRADKHKLNNSIIQTNASAQDLNRSQASLNLKREKEIDSNIAVANANLDKIAEECNLLNLQGKLTQKEIDSFTQRLQAEINEILSKTAKNYSDIRVNSEQIRLIAEQTATEVAKQFLYRQEGNEANERSVGLHLDNQFSSWYGPIRMNLSLGSANREQNVLTFQNGDWIDDSAWYGSGLKKIWKMNMAYGDWFTRGIGQAFGNVAGTILKAK